MTAGFTDLTKLDPDAADDKIELVTITGQVTGTATNSYTEIFSVPGQAVGRNNLYIIQSLYVTNVRTDSQPIIAPGLRLISNQSSGMISFANIQNDGTNTEDCMFVPNSIWLSPGDTMVYVDKTTPIYMEPVTKSSSTHYTPLEKLQFFSDELDGNSPYDWVLSYVNITQRD